MDISRNIADILQLYEFSMSIGRSLDYDTNCDNFIKVLLARKNFSACCIIDNSNKMFETRYCYPQYKNYQRSPENFEILKKCFSSKTPVTLVIDEKIKKVIPFEFDKGIIVFFPLKSDTGFFLFDNSRTELPQREINQLMPIMKKFTISLEACEAYDTQELLLGKLKSQNEELTNYAQAASHDLKSPLRKIDTIVQWIKEEFPDISHKLIEYLNIIENSVEHMDRITEGISRYSNIDKKKYQAIKIDLEEFLKNIVLDLEISPEIKIETKFQNSHLHFDPHRLELLLQNLITNAINFNDKEQVKITVEIKESKEEIELSVTDNGIGIPKKYQEKIFEIFQTLDDKTINVGIGLSIVKKIVDYYDGKIDVISEPKQGAKFLITLKKLSDVRMS